MFLERLGPSTRHIFRSPLSSSIRAGAAAAAAAEAAEPAAATAAAFPLHIRPSTPPASSPQPAPSLFCLVLRRQEEQDADMPAKRKMGVGSPQKFYAVRAGRRPGIYLTWPECQAQTAGFKGAAYKSFLTRQEAELFVAGKDPNPGVKKPDKFYAVAVGSKPGIYTDWAEAQMAYMGVKGPKYRKFNTRAEAENYMRSFAQYGQAQFSADGEEEEDDDEEENDDDDNDDDEEEDYDDDVAPFFEIEEPAKKKAKTATGAAGPSSGGAAGPILIYTDGSSLSNGRAGATAGVGVFFGKGDPRNISERLQGEPQTNQRAELTAILRALQAVAPQEDVRIFSDSKYAISCVTEWFASWERNGWRTRDGPVKNQDLVQAVLGRIREREARGGKTAFQWVKGHAATAGNVAADQLAVMGAKKRA